MSANLVTMSDVTNHIHEKQYFDYQKRFLAVANDGTVTLKLEATTKDMHVIANLDVEGKAYFDSYVDTVYTDDGTLQDTFNRFIDDAPAALSKIYLTPTVSDNGTQRFQKLIAAGSRPFSTGASTGGRVESIVAKGFNVYLVITNKSGSAQDFGVTIEWYEE